MSATWQEICDQFAKDAADRLTPTHWDKRTIKLARYLCENTGVRPDSLVQLGTLYEVKLPGDYQVKALDPREVSVAWLHFYNQASAILYWLDHNPAEAE